jgi:curved DNA-binding protein CbpA
MTPLLMHDKVAQPMSANLYEVLGAHKGDDFDTLRMRYRRLSRLYHPDTSFQSNAKEKFERINNAYTILSDPGKRELYDEFGQLPMNDTQLIKEAEGTLLRMLDELFNAVATAEDTAFEQFNVIKALQERCTAEISTLKLMMQKEKALCRKLDKIVTRLTRRGGDNVIALMTQGRIAASKQEQFKFATAQLVWDRVNKVLTSYEYQLPPKPTQPPRQAFEHDPWLEALARMGTGRR